MDHVGVVVDDLAAATEFFLALGLEAQGKTSAEGDWVDRIVGLQGVRTEVAFVGTPDRQGQLELIEFRSPPAVGNLEPLPANTLGLRHLTFPVDDIETVISRLRVCGAELVGEVENYQDMFLLCYVRGPAGIIVELAERIG
jgi:catechol 2,3-dioxygenase-like lactoylglutathione lyase family enzyme